MPQARAAPAPGPARAAPTAEPATRAEPGRGRPGGGYRVPDAPEGQSRCPRLAPRGVLALGPAPGESASRMPGAGAVVLAVPAAPSAAVARAVTASARTAWPPPPGGGPP